MYPYYKKVKEEGSACDLRGRHLVRRRCLLEGGCLFKEIPYSISVISNFPVC